MDTMQSVIHLRFHDIPNFREAAEVRTRMDKLHVAFMCKDITEELFRKRVFRLHQDSEISRQILDLLVAIQNAATDILYRIRDTFTSTSQLSQYNADTPAQFNTYYESLGQQMNEIKELRVYAGECLADIYHISSVNPKHRFDGEFSFAILIQ
jgi:hypothetical protein